MASKTNGRTKRLALYAIAGFCAASLSGCGPSAHERELEEQLAASKAQSAQKKLAVQTPQELPPPAPPQNQQADADSSNDNADDGDSNGSSFGDVSDADGGDQSDNDLGAGMDAPNDFPAPADPPLAGDLSPNDAPPHG